jgi:hypothetical protein
MSKQAIENTPFELIKSHCLNPDPEKSPLLYEHQVILERWISAAKILDRYPVMRKAVELHLIKFPGIKKTQAYEDMRNAQRLFNSIHTFDYDWWHTWLMNDIVEQIQACKVAGDLKAWAQGHSNLIKAIGEKPMAEMDPKLTEKNTFIIQFNINNKMVNVNMDTIHKLPQHIRREMLSGMEQDITDTEAEEILGT